MDEEVINDLYNRAVSQGYKKDRNAFVNLLHSDSEVFNDMYSYVQQKGYKKGVEDFSSLVGKGEPVKKKEPATVSPSENGSLVLQKPNPLLEVGKNVFENLPLSPISKERNTLQKPPAPDITTNEDDFSYGDVQPEPLQTRPKPRPKPSGKPMC